MGKLCADLAHCGTAGRPWDDSGLTSGRLSDALGRTRVDFALP